MFFCFENYIIGIKFKFQSLRNLQNSVWAIMSKTELVDVLESTSNINVLTYSAISTLSLWLISLEQGEALGRAIKITSVDAVLALLSSSMRVSIFAIMSIHFLILKSMWSISTSMISKMDTLATPSKFSITPPLFIRHIDRGITRCSTRRLSSWYSGASCASAFFRTPFLWG